MIMQGRRVKDLFDRLVHDYDELRALTDEQKEMVEAVRRMITIQSSWDEKKKDEYAFGREPF